MKKVKRIIKVTFLILIIFISATLLVSVSYYHQVTSGITLDLAKLEKNKIIQNFSVFDSNKNEIKPASTTFISLSKLSSNTKNAFICAEDKRFYSHAGLDFKRIGGAIISNLKTKSFSQGASTISQQLIKNTQLSNEKTINRKLKEIKLTKQLEKKYSKNEILEMYLNNIYFGNGCYGIENASKHYFGKSSTKLTLSESAMLAGTINAPSIYDIENNYQKANERKNLIIDLMAKNKKIDNNQMLQAKQEKVNLKINNINSNNYLFKSIISEACNILKIDEQKLNNANYKIFTNINSSLSKQIEKINKTKNLPADIANIVIDNKTHTIISLGGNINNLSKKYQPGSTIKPILVYAPAIEDGIINSSTELLDEKINICGYSPENADKIFHGKVTAKTALANSYNIPAVKLLNELGVEKAKSFAEKLKVPFEENDNHLALALGGFSKGITPKTIIDAYSSFALNGKFEQSSLITKITKNDKIIYEKKTNEKQVMQQNTANQITEMLLECAKTGTAKRLKELNFDVASKTGTVGKENSKENILAYNVCYTKNHTILTLISGENLNSKINGSTYPTIINKEIISELYKNNMPDNFDLQYQEKQVNTPSNNTQNKANNLYQLSITNEPNTKPILYFSKQQGDSYYIIRKHKNKEEIIFSSLNNLDINAIFIDKTAKTNEIYEYKIKFCVFQNNEELYSNNISLKAY